MMLLSFDFFSRVLNGKRRCTALLPADTQVGSDGKSRIVAPPYPSLCLLHGYQGDETDWVTHTRISHWAKAAGWAVIMPSGGNLFWPPDYVREVVEVSRRAFHLSEEREDTVIAGASMGGCGALVSALAFPSLFRASIVLSPALGMEGCPDWRTYSGTDRAVRFFIGCGKNDPLFDDARVLAEALRGKGYEARWMPSAGGHDWQYWDEALFTALDVLEK